MNGTEDLQTLLRTLSPELSRNVFVFVTLASEEIPADLVAECTFREKEGITVICEVSEADRHSFAYTGTYKRITLNVHSSLEAVGFLHAISGELTKAKISCNVVSAFYHDHLFVLESVADPALAVLRNISSSSSA